MLYPLVVRPFLFRLDAEEAHLRVMHRLAWLARHPGLARAISACFRVRRPALAVEAFGLAFENPVGLAAGLDKHGEAVGAWAALGFGFAEIGSVTGQPQDGNPRPRVFRLRRHGALVNRMGFNSVGADAAARNLAAAGRQAIPIGINLGKTKVVPNEEAAGDYCRSVRALHAHADYFVVNVSSPNTPGLRDLQRREPLAALLSTVRAEVDALGPRPVLVKLAPDLAPDELDDALAAAEEAAVAGLVVSNTTLSRAGVEDAPEAAEAGGLSGAPLFARSTEMIRTVRRRLGPRWPIIGVGGVASAAQAYAKIRAGATLVQVYTGLIYEGPAVVRRINRGLAALLRRDGLAHVREAVGLEA